MTATSSREANFSACATMARDASARGASMLFLPECFHFIGGGSDGMKSSDIAEPLDGPSMARYSALAKAQGLWLSLGGFQHRAKPSEKPRNTHIIIDDAGVIRASYDKLHLFDVELSSSVSLHESASTKAGDELVVIQSTPVGTIGLSVCYDLRFPQLYQSLARVRCVL
jgi:deaminated glutathione amidase